MLFTCRARTSSRWSITRTGSTTLFSVVAAEHVSARELSQAILNEYRYYQVLLPLPFTLLLWDETIELGIALPPLTVHSPSSRYWCYPSTSSSVFLSFFSPAPPSPSLSCPHILLLFSIRAHTTSTYFPALSLIFLPDSHLRCPCNSFISSLSL